MPSPWVKEPDGTYRCARHGETWALPASCPKCVDDPAPLEHETEPPPEPPPSGCLSSEELERRAVEHMDVIMSMLRSLRTTKAKKTNLHLFNTIAKLNDNWLKAARLAGEYASIRERRTHVKKLEERDREMRGERKRR